jgi:hypothetical protein
MLYDYRTTHRRTTHKGSRARTLLVVVAAQVVSAAVLVAATPVLAATSGRTPNRRKGRRSTAQNKKPAKPLNKIKTGLNLTHAPTTPDEKLAFLLENQFTTAELVLATGASIRGIEDRRRRLRERPPSQGSSRTSKVDVRIDALFGVVSLLGRNQIALSNVRAWLVGGSEYLEEQSPAVLLAAGHVELVRAAAMAYAGVEPPPEFLEKWGPIPRPLESVEA